MPSAANLAPPTLTQCGRCGSGIDASAPERTCLHCLVTDLAGLDSADWMASAASSSSLEIGGFALGKQIGHGGMGQVFLAQQRSPAREVAVKLLMPHLLGSDESRRRFLAESAALAELEHRGILPLYASGEEDGRPWIAMKLAKGGSLAAHKGKWIGRSQAAAEMMAHLADAMQHAHARGIIHRDLKPANILLDANDQAWVADFGLAKWRHAAEAHTLSYELMGTPAYMAPEVAQQGAKAATTASDIYGLGAILYELLTGQAPYVAASPTEILVKLAANDPVPPRTIQAAIPRDLEVICLRALERTPLRRYETAAGLAADLRRFLAGDPVLARPQSTGEKIWRWVRKHPWPTGLAAALVLVAGLSTGKIVSQNTTLTARNDALTQAQAGWKSAQGDAEGRVTYAVDVLAPQLEDLGRSDIMEDIFTDIGKYFSRRNEDSKDGISLLRRVKFLIAWSRNLRYQGRVTAASEKLKEAQSLAEFSVQQPHPPVEAWIAQAQVNRRLAEFAALSEIIPDPAKYMSAATTAITQGLTISPNHPEMLLSQAEVLGEQCDQFLIARLPEKPDFEQFEIAWQKAIQANPQTTPQEQRAMLQGQAKVPYLRAKAAELRKDWVSAESHHRQYLAAHQDLCEREPNVPVHRLNIAIANSRIAQAITAQGSAATHPETGLEMQETAEQMLAKLTQEDHRNSRYKAEYGLLLMHKGRPFFTANNFAEAADILGRAYQLLKEIPDGTRIDLDESKYRLYKTLLPSLSKTSQGDAACATSRDALNYLVEKYQSRPSKWKDPLLFIVEAHCIIHGKFLQTEIAKSTLEQALATLDLQEIPARDWPQTREKLIWYLHNLHSSKLP
jgi:serine/threonine protein kinase